MGRSGTSACAVYALFSHFWYVGGFGNLGEPVVWLSRTLRHLIMSELADGSGKSDRSLTSAG